MAGKTVFNVGKKECAMAICPSINGNPPSASCVNSEAFQFCRLSNVLGANGVNKAYDVRSVNCSECDTIFDHEIDRLTCWANCYTNVLSAPADPVQSNTSTDPSSGSGGGDSKTFPIPTDAKTTTAIAMAVLILIVLTVLYYMYG